jgi:hypothetical protein
MQEKLNHEYHVKSKPEIQTALNQITMQTELRNTAKHFGNKVITSIQRIYLKETDSAKMQEL